MQTKDFVYKYPPGWSWCLLSGFDSYTIPGAQRSFWNSSQAAILVALQKEINQGWKPITEVGPAAIKIRTYKSMRYDFFGWIVIFLVIIASMGIALIFLPFLGNQYAEPVECRITLQQD